MSPTVTSIPARDVRLSHAASGVYAPSLAPEVSSTQRVSMEGADDALQQWKADQQSLQGLFDAYRKGVQAGITAARRQSLAQQICVELAIHTRLKQELLYEAARSKTDVADVFEWAAAAQAEQKDLMAHILAASGQPHRCDALVSELAACVARETEHEQKDLVAALSLQPALHRQALGQQMIQRRDELRTVAEALCEELVAAAVL